MKQKYREYLRLNKNILLAFAASIIISAVVADYLSDQQDYLNSTLTLVADYCVFFTTFGILFYIDNRKKYRTETGELKKITIKVRFDQNYNFSWNRGSCLYNCQMEFTILFTTN